MASTAEIDARNDVLAAITKLLQDIRPHLANNGYQAFRMDEWLNSITGRHLRTGYAGGEWTIVVSARKRHNYEQIRVIRLDSRTYLGKPLPTIDELIRQIVE